MKDLLKRAQEVDQEYVAIWYGKQVDLLDQSEKLREASDPKILERRILNSIYEFVIQELVQMLEKFFSELSLGFSLKNFRTVGCMTRSASVLTDLLCNPAGFEWQEIQEAVACVQASTVSKAGNAGADYAAELERIRLRMVDILHKRYAENRIVVPQSLVQTYGLPSSGASIFP